MKKSSRWLITFAICLSVFILLAGYKYLQIQAAIAFGKSFPEASATVEAEVVEEDFFSNEVTVTGEVIAPQSVLLRNELEGRITAINFSPGAQVEANDILVELDTSEERARLKGARARVELARLALERAEKLYRQKTVSTSQVDQARAEFEIAKADVQALQAIIDKKTLRAPFPAIPGLHQFDEGEFLNANTPIVNLVGVSDFTWVEFSLPAAQTGVDTGTEVYIEPLNPSQPGMTAQIVAKDSAASAASRNIRVRALLKEEHNLAPNSSVKVRVPLEQIRQVVIPTPALLKDAMGDYVFELVKEPGTENYRAQRRTVEITRQNDQVAAINSGLPAGALIATRGAFKLQQGLLTHIASPQAAPGDEKPLNGASGNQ